MATKVTKQWQKEKTKNWSKSPYIRENVKTKPEKSLYDTRQVQSFALRSDYQIVIN